MKLLGKKRTDGEGQENKRKPQRIKRKYKKPNDVKWFYFMPALLVIGVICMVVGGIMVHNNSVAYNKKIMASSMAKGQELTLRNGESEGTLKMGNSLLSADEKTLAVEIEYDSEAHSHLSSYGQNYNLFLVDTEDNVMDDAELSYGMFGTDGSGVLRIHNDKGFKNKAFMVFLLDKGVLSTSDELRTGQAMTDAEIDKSLSAQLSEIEEQDSDEEDTTMDDDRLPPTYIARLNAHSAEKSYRNWSNDRQLVEDLFVDDNLKKIDKEKKKIEGQIEKGETTLEEMEQRLEENPADEIAESNKRDVESSLDRLEDDLQNAEDNYENITSENIEKSVLDPVQSDFNRYTVIDINKVQ